MISQATAERLNSQLNLEFASAYLYLGFAAQAESADLRGAAAWFFAKYGEETGHALKIYRYLLDQDASVSLDAVAKPPMARDSLREMFQATLEHEQAVTVAINGLVDAALSEKDHATHIFLQWFVTEQIEEEATVKEILGRIERFGEEGQALLIIDNELREIGKQISTSANVVAPTPGA